MKNTVLIDTNIFIDVFQAREPFCKSSERIIQMAAENTIYGYLAAHTIPNLWYILRKTHTEKDRRALIHSLLECFEISGLTKEVIKKAVDRENFKDFEDCLQDECAKAAGCTAIITRNPGDFAHSRIKAITPEDFLKTDTHA